MAINNFTARHRAMLRAIADGRGQIVVARATNLSVDGLWCDFSATNDLVGNGLVQPVSGVPAGSIAPAVLTANGVRTLAALSG